MPEPATDPVRVGFTRWGWAALGVVALLMVGQLALQLVLLEDQRTSVDRQLAVAATQQRQLEPVARRLGPLLDDQRRAGPEIARLRDRSLELTRIATPLVRDLRDARVDETSREVGALARTLLSADLPRLSRALTATGDELARQHRLRRLLVRSLHVLGETQARDLVAKSARAAELVPRQLAVLEQSRDIQRATLDTQRQALELIRQTLAVARETKRHAESLDRKTGGGAPPSAGTGSLPASGG